MDVYKDWGSAPYVLGAEIGRGQHIVRMARSVTSGSKLYPYAQKTLEFDQDSIATARLSFQKEVQILRQAQHHHVVELISAYEFWSDKPQLCIVMTRARESIQDFVLGKRQRPRDLEQMRRWYHCLANATDHIHCLGIRHRDIKPANILVQDSRVLLADFGISRMGLTQTLSTTVPQWARARTSAYCAPEVEGGSSRGRSADIFSLGAVFLEMLLAHSYPSKLGELATAVTLPADGSNFFKSYAKRVTEVHSWICGFEDTMDCLPSDWRRVILNLCRNMLHEDRDERPRASEVLKALPPLPQTPSRKDTALMPCNCAAVQPQEWSVAFVDACKRGDLDKVKNFVQGGAEASVPGAIHQASAFGHASIVRHLLELKVDTDLLNHSNQTALHCAAGHGHGEVVRILLHYKALVNARDVEGRTALHYAAGIGHEEIVEMLLDAHRGEAGQVAALDEDGRIPLHFAAKNGHTKTAQMLLERLPEWVDTPDNRGLTPLHFAAAHGRDKMVSVLLGHGANPGTQDRRGWTATRFATKGRQRGGNYDEVARLLLEHALDISIAERNELAEEHSSGTGSETNAVDAMKNAAAGNLLAGFHPDIISFLTISQIHKVDIWPISGSKDLEFLGKGATGDVRQSIVDLKHQFAIKRFTSFRQVRYRDHDIPSNGVTDSVFDSIEKLFTALISELVILSRQEIMLHPHIIHIEAVAFDVEDDGRGSFSVWPVLIMKKAEHGNLARVMASERGSALNLSDKLKLCAQIASAISTMHSNDIVHGDVKPQNILVDAEGETITAKVTDFSYSCMGRSGDSIVHLPKSVPWHSPEYGQGEFTIHAAKLADVFSFGMVCLWLLFPKAFDDIVCGTWETRGCANADSTAMCLQNSAEKLALEESSLGASFGQSLASFFRSTLCLNPRERNGNWQELVAFLGQQLWQPEKDAMHQPTLATYGATEEDIEDPDKCQILMTRIFDSLHFIDRQKDVDKDVIRDFYDSVKLMDKQTRVLLISSLFENLRVEGLTSPEKKKWAVEEITHNCLNVSDILYQLLNLDYRVRVHIVRHLEKWANGPCGRCAELAAHELGLCYTLGFGASASAEQAQKWLAISKTTDDRLHQRIDHLRTLPLSSMTETRYSAAGSQGVFTINALATYGNSHIATAEAEIAREIHDLEQQLGDEHWIVFDMKLLFSNVLLSQEKIEEAAKVLETLRLSKRVGQCAPHHLQIQLGLARIYKIQGRWDEAELFLAEAKSASVDLMGPANPLTIAVCQTLADVYAWRGEYQKATREYEDLRKALAKVFPANHSCVQMLNEHYGRLLESQGKFEEVIELSAQHAQAVMAPERYITLGYEHNQGRKARLEGNPDIAEGILYKVKREAENLSEQSSNSEDASHFIWLANMASRNLALVFRDQQRFDEAEGLQRELLHKLERSTTQSHTETLNVTYDLARTLQMRNKWDEAEELQRLIKTKRAKLLGPFHPDTIVASQRLVEIYTAKNKVDEAEAEMQMVENALVERLGVCHQDTIFVARRLSELYISRGKLAMAEDKLIKSISIWEGGLGPYNEITLSAKNNLGWVYLTQGRLREAEEILKQTLEDMRTHMGPDHEATGTTSKNLSAVYAQHAAMANHIDNVGGNTGSAYLWPPWHVSPQEQQQQQHQFLLVPLSEEEQIELAIELSFQTQRANEMPRTE